jgi:hypothetical protein
MNAENGDGPSTISRELGSNHLKELRNSRGKWRWQYTVVGGVLVLAVGVTLIVFGLGNTATRSTMSFTALIKPVPSTHLTNANVAILRKVESSVPSLAAEMKILKNSGVSLSVNGTSVGLEPIASHVVGFENTFLANAAKNAQRVGFRTSAAVATVKDQVATAALDAAVAYEALVYLCWQASQHDGHEVSLAAAQAYAENEYRIYKTSHSTSSSNSAPSGVGSPQQVFLSPNAVEGYRIMMSISAEMTAIAGPQTFDTKTDMPVNRTPALSSWMEQQLSGNQVPAATTHKRSSGNVISVANVPGVSASNIASMLPAGL